jgi:hypothetical protein
LAIKAREFLKISLRQFSLRMTLPLCTALLELPSIMVNRILRAETHRGKRHKHHLQLSKIKIKKVPIN